MTRVRHRLCAIAAVAALAVTPSLAHAQDLFGEQFGVCALPDQQEARRVTRQEITWLRDRRRDERLAAERERVARDDEMGANPLGYDGEVVAAAADFKTRGVEHNNGYDYLIPMRVDLPEGAYYEDGAWRWEDGLVVAATSAVPFGTVIQTPVGTARTVDGAFGASTVALAL